MELRTLAILMAVAIVMDFVGRMNRRRLAEQDPAADSEPDDNFLAALMEAGSAEREGTAEERAGEGERRTARDGAEVGSGPEEGRGGWAVAAEPERRVRARPARRPPAEPVRQVAAEPRAPSVLEVLAGVAPAVAAPGTARDEETVAPERRGGRAPGRTRPEGEGKPRREAEAAGRGGEAGAAPALSDPATVRARSRVVRPRLGGGRGLRDAVVAREILGPPVALRPGTDAADRNEIR